MPSPGEHLIAVTKLGQTDAVAKGTDTDPAIGRVLLFSTTGQSVGPCGRAGGVRMSKIRLVGLVSQPAASIVFGLSCQFL